MLSKLMTSDRLDKHLKRQITVVKKLRNQPAFDASVTLEMMTYVGLKNLFVFNTVPKFF